MSQENVEVVLKMFTAFGRRDMERLLAACHPEVTYRAATTQIVGERPVTFVGMTASGGGGATWDDLYDDLHAEVLEVRNLGERVLVVFHIHGRGKGSGVARVEQLAQVATVRDGQVMEMRHFSRHDALEAVGLRE